jgi:hypothetical protein
MVGQAANGFHLGPQATMSYNEKLWMLDLLKAVTYPPS